MQQQTMRPEPVGRIEPLSKVARVTLAFWVMKVLSTTLGETAGDYISMTLGMGYYAGLAITFAILASSCAQIAAGNITSPYSGPR